MCDPAPGVPLGQRRKYRSSNVGYYRGGLWVPLPGGRAKAVVLRDWICGSTAPSSKPPFGRGRWCAPVEFIFSYIKQKGKKEIKNSVLFFIRPPWSDSSGRPGGHQEAAHMCVDFKQGRRASRRAEPGWAVHPNYYQTSKMWVNDHIAVLQRKTGRSDPDQLHPSSAMHCPAASWWLA